MNSWVYDILLVSAALANFGLLWLALRHVTREDPVVNAAKLAADAQSIKH